MERPTKDRGTKGQRDKKRKKQSNKGTKGQRNTKKIGQRDGNYYFVY